LRRNFLGYGQNGRMPFSGFSPEGLKFLRSLKRNNRREWFQPRKEIFDTHLKVPMEQLVEEINSALDRFAPEYVTESKKAVFRIYRDTRFSNDKTPYKTHIAAWFKKRGINDKSAGGFYFHVSPEEVVAAAGVFMPPADQVLALRKFLLENHDRYTKLAKDKKLRKLEEFEGESLQRDPKGFPKDHPASPLIRRKQWGWHQTWKPDLAATPKLLPELVASFKIMAPAVMFLNEAFALKKPRREFYFD
jgi:uncharacterized protein (TIGR02453 family)